MEEQVVRSYVRNKQQHVEPAQTQVNWQAAIVGGASLVLLAITYWRVTALLAFVALVWYAGREVKANWNRTPDIEPEPIVEVEEAPEVKPKRHYQHRLRVNHYQIKKPVRV